MKYCLSSNQTKEYLDKADEIMVKYKDREIIAVPSTALIRQHGSIHCSAMQFPAGVYETNKTKTI